MMQNQKRKQPEDGIWYEWRAFERWADRNGIGVVKSDWGAWWGCWKAAYSAAMNAGAETRRITFTKEGS